MRKDIINRARALLIIATILILTGCVGNPQEPNDRVTIDDPNTIVLNGGDDNSEESEESEEEYEEEGETPDETEAEPEEDVPLPADFVQKAAGKTEFESFDEILSYLTKGQGYAYVRLDGCDEDMLLITDIIYPYKGVITSNQASVYSKSGDVYVNLGSIAGADKNYPLAVSGDSLYTYDDYNYNVYFINPESKALVTKEHFYQSDVTPGQYFGSYRERATDEYTEFNGGQEEFEQFSNSYFESEVVVFTAVE